MFFSSWCTPQHPPLLRKPNCFSSAAAPTKSYLTSAPTSSSIDPTNTSSAKGIFIYNTVIKHYLRTEGYRNNNNINKVNNSFRVTISYESIRGQALTTQLRSYILWCKKSTCTVFMAWLPPKGMLL
ncbi:hypothetical protein BX616_010943 [Lobosporangium transversale]|nr:hypothetical protein BX616_010943 [Lobosporangium transversale]